MKGAFFYPTLSAIIAGLVLAAAGFFIFKSEPLDPLASVQVEYRSLWLSSRLLTEPVIAASKEAAEDPGKVLKTFANFFGFRSKVAVLSFRVRNSSSKLLDSVTAHLGQYSFGYVEDEDGIRSLDGRAKTTVFKVLPGKTAELFLVADYNSAFVEQRFTVDGQAIAIKEIEPFFSNEPVMIETYRAYPFSFFMLATLGAIGIVGLILALLFHIFSKKTPASLAGVTDVGTMATHLALLNWLREEDAEKYRSIVAKAERIHGRWKQAQNSTDT